MHFYLFFCCGVKVSHIASYLYPRQLRSSFAHALFIQSKVPEFPHWGACFPKTASARSSHSTRNTKHDTRLTARKVNSLLSLSHSCMTSHLGISLRCGSGTSEKCRPLRACPRWTVQERHPAAGGEGRVAEEAVGAAGGAEGGAGAAEIGLTDLMTRHHHPMKVRRHLQSRGPKTSPERHTGAQGRIAPTRRSQRVVVGAAGRAVQPPGRPKQATRRRKANFRLPHSKGRPRRRREPRPMHRPRAPASPSETS